MRWLALGVLLAVLTSGAPARTVEVVFDTEPSGATIHQLSPTQNHYLGVSGAPVPVDLSLAMGSELKFRLARDGYQEYHLSIGAHSFDDGVLRWPKQEGQTLRLAPASSWVAVRDLLRPAAVPAVVLLVAGAGLLARRRRPAPAELPPAGETVVGGYRLGELLGRGGMADVYRAEPVGGGEAVAIKLMRDELSRDDHYRQRFEREIRVCKDLDHPGIVRLIDWGDHEGHLYLVLELIDGKTLRELMNEGLSDADAARYLVESMKTVAYAHEKGVVHRDLKPDNLMVTSKGRLKVMDFGLARDQKNATITASGMALGTPAYMSPEQIQSERPTPASDQYALGMMAYELLGGRHPFEDEDTLQLVFKHLSQTPPPVRSLRPELPEALDAVLLTMVAKSPAQRYPDLEEAASALEAALWG